MPVAETSRAVFLSYASQDDEAAERIATTLRAAGIEVWFDKSELRGGDVWDQKIRRELHACALFIPVVSSNTAARHEGYFRLEWDLADQRSHMIARNRAFVVPVCVDATPEASADTPESFQRVQWTRLPRGETSAAFVERIQRLLSGEAGFTSERAHSAGAVSSPSPRGRRKRLLFGATAAAALLVGGGFGLEWINRSNSGINQAVSSIAVLPLANEGGEASQQYFSDGISEDLITALSQFQGLKVIGRSSAFKFRDSKEDSRSIGARLGVAHLLEGSVRRAGDMVRISAALIDTADGSTQWSAHYDRPYRDLFALQDEITNAVAGALTAKLLPENAATQSDRPPSGNLEAYNAMLQGRFYMARGTEIDLRKSIEQFTVATQLDPGYALAWSLLSLGETFLGGEYLSGAAAQETYSKARWAADKALALAPNLAAAHRAQSRLLEIADFKWREAESQSRIALQLAPNDGGAMANLAGMLATLGRAEAAIPLMRKAVAIDPLTAIRFDSLALYQLSRNRLEEAETAVRKAIDLQPGAGLSHWHLTLIEILRGDPQGALVAAQDAPPGVWRDIALAQARQIGIERADADTALDNLIKKHADESAYQIAQAFAMRKDADKTFEWLERALSNRDGGLELLLLDPFLLRYKDDPRFAAFCLKVGLPVPGEAPSASRLTPHSYLGGRPLRAIWMSTTGTRDRPLRVRVWAS